MAKNDEVVPLIPTKGEPTPGWEKLLYAEDRVKKWLSGEMTARELHGVSGPEMMQMALIGYRMYEEGKYSDAKTVFRGLITLDPKIGYFHTAMGVIHMVEGDLEAAGKAFDVALHFNPDDMGSLVSRGEVQLRLGNIDEAVADFKRAVDLDPTGKDPQAQRARVLAATTLDAIQRATASASEAKSGGGKAAKK